MGLILNSIQGHLTIPCLKKEAVGFEVKEIIHCSKLSSYAVSRAPTKPSLRKLQKKNNNFGPDFGPFGPNLGAQNFFYTGC